MGWADSHLHIFSDGIKEYSSKEFEIEYAKDSRTVRLNKILKEENFKINYEYDFGDGWEQYFGDLFSKVKKGHQIGHLKNRKICKFQGIVK